MTTKKPEYPYKNDSNISYTKIIITLILSVMFLSVSGCTDNDSSPVISVTLTTNNDTYRSSEEMVITIDITASRDVDIAIVNISGIKNTFERNLLEESKTVRLMEGENTVEFTFETPECGDCAGVATGNHSINAIVEVDGTQYNVTSIVILEADDAESETEDGNVTEDTDTNVTTVEADI